MSSTHSIRDNHQRGTVAQFLRDKAGTNSVLSFVSAYFTIYAYDKLKDVLNQIDHLNFLFGEPHFIHAIDPDDGEHKAFRIEDASITLANRLTQRAVAQACAAWIRDRVDIRSIRKPGFLHGKLYYIDPPGSEAHAILGSSNFTAPGIGEAGQANNIELNLIVNDRRDLAELEAWFKELWNNTDLVVDVKADVLRYLEQLYADYPPQFIYYKTLYHLFEGFLRDQAGADLLDEHIGITESEIWKTLFEFQKDGAKGAINKLLKHNGCVLADSVGLGKTYEALAVIKYFELRNERVLVLCPKKLEDNWTLYRNNDRRNPLLRDRFQYDVLAHTDLSRISGRAGQFDLSTFNWGNYNLVVIDESHNFRNDTKGKDGRKSRYERLMQDVIKSGVKTKVLLLSATPVNNDLGDLRNQIYFMTEGEDGAFAESLGIPSVRNTLQGAQQTFMGWARRKGSRDTNSLLESLSSAFFTLLDELTIARSREHVRRYYAAAYQQLGGFPERAKPVSIFADIDNQQGGKSRFMSYDQLSRLIDQYKLVVFNPWQYVRQEHRAKYAGGKVSNFTQADRENYLIGMMKVNFLKRLESSVSAFALTMQRTIDKIEALEDRIVRFREFAAENPSLDLESVQMEDVDDQELMDALEVGEKLSYRMAHLDVDRWLQDLTLDKSQLSTLLRSAQRVTPDRDAKMAELKRLIEHKVNQPTVDKHGRPNRKVLVFTAFADTAAYLYDNLAPWARKSLGIHAALVTGGSNCRTTLGDSDFVSILTNFAPIAKKRDQLPDFPQTSAIELLIATDCISEGQNLQDCDTVVNYDIHWNPVRIIQRFGRVDRIGSPNTAVHLVNFWPTRQLDDYIRVKNRVEARMAPVDVTATNYDNLLKPDLEDLVREDLAYRDKQLLRLKDEVLDMDEFNESGVSLSEFTLDDFRAELARFIEANRALLQSAPLGLYAVAPPLPEPSPAQPGVIFCLRQKTPTDPSDPKGGAWGIAVDKARPAPPFGSMRESSVNPLQPHFLVYVRDDGVVRFNFTHPKQILTLYRELCAGETTAYEELCRRFDQQTRDGSEMTFYNDLLQKAVNAIVSSFRKRAVGSLALIEAVCCRIQLDKSVTRMTSN